MHRFAQKHMVAVAAWIVAGLAIPSAAAAQDRADVCMAVGLDASGSISAEEMRLQVDGMAAALLDARFGRAIRAGPRGLIAITVYTWADSHDGVEIVVPWAGLESAKDAEAVAAFLRGRFSGQGERSTSLTVALKAGAELLAGCPWFADRQLLNVAGDGWTNAGPGPAAARDHAIDRGIVINGLVVGNNRTTVQHYRGQVIGPPNIGFLVEVGSYRDFAQAMINKLLLELAAVAEGGR